MRKKAFFALTLFTSVFGAGAAMAQIHLEPFQAAQYRSPQLTEDDVAIRGHWGSDGWYYLKVKNLSTIKIDVQVYVLQQDGSWDSGSLVTLRPGQEDGSGLWYTHADRRGRYRWTAKPHVDD